MTPSTWDGIGIPATPEYNVQVHAPKLNGPYFEEQLMLTQCLIVAQDSSVGIVTYYGLDSPGTESQWGGETFCQTGPEAHPASYTMGRESFIGAKWPGCGIGHPPPSTDKVKEREKLYLYPPSGPLWLVSRWTLPLP
jgi:hypothetical protein